MSVHDMLVLSNCNCFYSEQCLSYSKLMIFAHGLCMLYDICMYVNERIDQICTPVVESINLGCGGGGGGLVRLNNMNI